MKTVLIILIIWFILNFEYCGAAYNKISNYYALLPLIERVKIDSNI